jgi:hypothetical protein
MLTPIIIITTLTLLYGLIWYDSLEDKEDV